MDKLFDEWGSGRNYENIRIFSINVLIMFDLFYNILNYLFYKTKAINASSTDPLRDSFKTTNI